MSEKMNDKMGDKMGDMMSCMMSDMMSNNTKDTMNDNMKVHRSELLSKQSEEVSQETSEENRGLDYEDNFVWQTGENGGKRGKLFSRIGCILIVMVAGLRKVVAPNRLKQILMRIQDSAKMLLEMLTKKRRMR